MVIDSHAHITSKDFSQDRDDVIRRALDAGVMRIVNPAINLEDTHAAIDLAEKYDEIYACAGVHPHEANGASDELLISIGELADHKKVVAIGEIGLDFYYDFAPREVQVRVFTQQLHLARAANL